MTNKKGDKTGDKESENGDTADTRPGRQAGRRRRCQAAYKADTVANKKRNKTAAHFRGALVGEVGFLRHTAGSFWCTRIL